MLQFSQHIIAFSTLPQQYLKQVAGITKLSDQPSASAKRALEILEADRQRTGTLDPERVDDLLEKRSLDASERAWIYEQVGMQARVSSLTEPLDEGPDDDIDTENGVDMDHIGFLLKATKDIPLLSPEKERQLGRAIQNGLLLRHSLKEQIVENTPEVRAAVRRAGYAQKRMILANLRLVVTIANRYRGRSGLDVTDLVQEGIIGLMRAVQKFDPEMDVRFSTYGSWWIRQSIERSIYDKSKTIRIPVHMAEKVAKLKRTERRLRAVGGSERCSIAHLADELGWDRDETEKVYSYLQMSVSSLDDVIYEDGDTTLGDMIEDPFPSPEDTAIRTNLSEVLSEMMTDLSPREADIIKRRFGLYPGSSEGETLEEIGIDYSVTRERIRQIEAKALRRLRHPKRLKRLKAFLE